MSEELIQRVLKVIATSKRIPPETVTIDSAFQQLGIDSMDAVEILFALENEFDISIPDDEVRSVRNVRQMCEGVESWSPPRSDAAASQVDAPRRDYRHRRDLRAGPQRRRIRRSPLRQGRGGIGPIQSTDMLRLPLSERRRSEGLHATRPYFEDRRADFMDRFAQFAVIAAREAVDDAGVEWTPELRETAAIITGSCVGGQSTEDIGFQEIYKQGSNRVHPLTIPKTMANAGASHISMEFGITGPSFTISTACSSAAHAIGQAFWMVRSGVTDLRDHGRQRSAVQLRNPEGVGGDARGVAGHLPAVFEGPPRHDPGRGRGDVRARALEAALARGARIHAEIVGFGMSADACHITQPSVEGAARAMRAALRDARTGAGADRLHQRARHRHAGQRCHRDRRDPRGFRRSCRPAAGQLHQDPCTATRWARRPRSNAGHRRSRCATASCRPPPTSASPTRSAIWTSSPTGPAGGGGVRASNSFAFGGLNAVLAVRSA